jgi:hypothetical protein
MVAKKGRSLVSYWPFFLLNFSGSVTGQDKSTSAYTQYKLNLIPLTTGRSEACSQILSL